MKIAIHPGFSPVYYSMVLSGFIQSGHTLSITTKGFPPPDYPEFYIKRENMDREQMAMILQTDKGNRRVVVSADDFAAVRSGHIEWADVIAKVNISTEMPDHLGRATLLPLGPTFGIRLPAYRAASYAALRFIALSLRQRDHISLREEIADYVFRRPESDYRSGRGERDYIFFIATSWENLHPEVNPSRAVFMNVCRSLEDLTFEGGFAPRSDGETSDFPGLYLSRRYTISEYIANTRRSLCAFNSPAVHGCLGWKLGEFLALGKAIISMDLGRKMPGSFEPYEHFIPVDGSDGEIVEALDRLRRDTEFRRRLEERARAYYVDFLSPPSLARRIISAAVAS